VPLRARVPSRKRRPSCSSSASTAIAPRSKGCPSASEASRDFEARKGARRLGDLLTLGLPKEFLGSTRRNPRRRPRFSESLPGATSWLAMRRPTAQRIALCPHRPSLTNQLRGDRWVFGPGEQSRQVPDGCLESASRVGLPLDCHSAICSGVISGDLGSSIWLVLSSAANSGRARSKPKSAASACFATRAVIPSGNGVVPKRRLTI
jgi:hypothetical protein